MLYGVLILSFSTFLAVMIRIKSDKESCIVKKVLPFLIILIGGVIATLFVMINRT